MRDFIIKSGILFSSEYENILMPQLIKDGWFYIDGNSLYSIGERIEAELESLLQDLFPYSCYLCKEKIFTEHAVMCCLCPQEKKLCIHQACLSNLNALELRCPLDINHRFDPIPFQSFTE